MKPKSLAILILLAGCTHPGRPQTGASPTATGAITEQQSHTTALLQAVSAVNDSVVWVSGHHATWVRTVDGGRTWVAGAMTGPDSALEFRDVEAVSATTAYLLAAGPGEQSRIYKTTDAGQRWRLQFMNHDSAAFYDCFGFWDATHGIAVSDAAHGRMIVIRTDDGEHWSPAAEGGMPPAVPGEGSPAAGGTCLIVRGHGQAWFGTEPNARVYRSEDRGRNWSVATTPIVSGEAAGVATLAFSGAVYGSSVVPGMPGYVVVAGPKGLDWTRNDGGAWTNLSVSAYWAVACSSSHACWAVGPQGRITSVTFVPPVR
jgi:photosystem II stability/assembly factor-like uncharacterized protein